MSDLVRIRAARQEEYEVLVELAIRAYQEYSSEFSEEGWLRYQESIRSAICEPSEVTKLVAVLHDALVGLILLYPPYEVEIHGHLLRNDYPEFRFLAVDPARRNCGAGARLIEACESLAAEMGFARLSLHTTNMMKTAKQMYERRGFERYPSIDFELSPGVMVLGFIKELPVTAGV